MAHRKHYIRDAIGRFARVASRKAVRYVRREVRKSIKRDIADAKAIGRTVAEIMRGPLPYDPTPIRRHAARTPMRRNPITDNGLLRYLLAASPDDVRRGMAHTRKRIVATRRKRPAARKVARR